MASSPAAAPTTGPPVTASPPSSPPPAPTTSTPTAPAPSPPAQSPPAPATPAPATPSAPSPPAPATPAPATPATPATPSTPSPPSPATTTPSPPSSTTPSPPPPSSSTSPSPPSSTTPSPPPPSSSTTTPSSSTTPSPPTSSSPSTPSSSSSSTPSSSSSSSPPSSSSSSISTGAVVAVGLAGVLAITVVAILIYCLCCRRKKKYYPPNYYGPPGGLATHAHYKDNYYPPSNRQGWSTSTAGSDVALKPPPPPVPHSPKNGYDPIPPPPPPPGGPASGMPNSKAWYSYEELEDATDGFARHNMLGEGGFGCVYKGTMSDGVLVAVKQLKAGATQGEREFMAEVEIISRVHHRHLVSLVGYCIADSQRLLVYDYVPNGTLEYHLHKRKSGPVLDWPSRLKIAIGAARGLAYLHEDCHPRIIHRDIKSSNILLDDNFEAQVSDFGLAKLSLDTNTHVSTRVMGTFGYLAPEYASTGKLTEKSDVFSFGVVLLELLTGRKPVDASQPMGDESLVEWARPILSQINGEEDLDLVADPALDGEYNAREMLRMAEAAAACVRHSANKRPKMTHVVRALEDDSSLSDLNRGLRPGHSSVYGSLTSAEYDNASTYSAEMRKFRKTAFESQEYGGSEYSGATSEYGINPSASSGEYQMASREMANREMKPTLPSQRTRPPLSVRRTGTSSDFTSG